MLNIIAHRGYWLNNSEKNTSLAFARALQHGFGIETDFRDFDGTLVVSHDPPSANSMKISELVKLYRDQPVTAPMALNIKSDGLHELVIDLIQRAKFKNAFAFDMAVPDMRGYINKKIPIFTRLSEYERYPALLESSNGVWLDAFESQWYSTKTILSLLDQNKQVAIVSSELHGRPYTNLWDWIKGNHFHQDPLISICTDFPMHAKEFFYGQD
jgi:glycerophosphoryl diester phosphodiesterase